MRLKSFINEITTMSPQAVEKFVSKYKHNISKAISNSKNIKTFCKNLNKIFNKNHITFKYSRSNEDDVGIIGGKFDFDKEETVVYISNVNLDMEDLDDFILDLSSTLGHEFIHMFQSIKAGGLESKEHKNLADYIKSHPETEAYAYDTYSELRLGKTDKLISIQVILKNDIKTWKRFLKKVYLYSQKDKKALEILKQFKFLNNLKDFKFEY